MGTSQRKLAHAPWDYAGGQPQAQGDQATKIFVTDERTNGRMDPWTDRRVGQNSDLDVSEGYNLSKHPVKGDDYLQFMLFCVKSQEDLMQIKKTVASHRCVARITLE